MYLLNKIYNNIVIFFKTHAVARWFLVYGFFVLCFMWVYFGVTTLSSGDDHYFHIRFAEIISQEGFVKSFRNFDSIYFSKMLTGSYTVYYNFLFYLVLIPFTHIAPLYLGIKLYAVLVAALCFAVLYQCFKWFNIKYAFLWTCFLLAITGFSSLFRLFLSRPYVLAPVILLLIIISCFKKRYNFVFLLSFLYLFWHSLTFYFSIAVVGVYYFFDYFYTQKYNWKILVSVISGTVLAVGVSYLIVPGFLNYVWDLIFGIFRETIIGKKVLIPEGGELYPGSFFDVINGNLFLFPFFVTAIVVQLFQIKKYWPGRGEIASLEKKEELTFSTTLFFLCIGFFLGAITISMRFGDFFIFFSLFFIAYIFNSVFKNIVFLKPVLKKVVMVGIFISFAYIFINANIVLRSMIASGSASEEFQQTGKWLRNNTDKDDIVFYPNWSWFAQLFYHSPHNNYIMGLEPRFLYDYDPQLYWKWASISNYGYVCSQETCPKLDQIYKESQKKEKLQNQWYKEQGDILAKTLNEDFKSKYVVTIENAPMNKMMDNNKQFKKVYEEDGKKYFIYKVTP